MLPMLKSAEVFTSWGSGMSVRVSAARDLNALLRVVSPKLLT